MVGFGDVCVHVAAVYGLWSLFKGAGPVAAVRLRSRFWSAERRALDVRVCEAVSMELHRVIREPGWSDEARRSAVDSLDQLRRRRDVVEGVG
jgi:hypothetical protein